MQSTGGAQLWVSSAAIGLRCKGHTNDDIVSASQPIVQRLQLSRIHWSSYSDLVLHTRPQTERFALAWSLNVEGARSVPSKQRVQTQDVWSVPPEYNTCRTTAPPLTSIFWVNGQ